MNLDSLTERELTALFMVGLVTTCVLGLVLVDQLVLRVRRWWWRRRWLSAWERIQKLERDERSERRD